MRYAARVKTQIGVVVALALTSACNGKDKVDFKVVDKAIATANACKDVACAEEQLKVVRHIIGSATHGLSKEDIDRVMAAEKLIELRQKVIQEDGGGGGAGPVAAGGKAAPAGEHATRKQIFRFMYQMCRLSFADPNPPPDQAAKIAPIQADAEKTAAKLGITIPPRPPVSKDPKENGALVLGRLAQIMQGGMTSMKDYPPGDTALLGVGVNLCALWANYVPGDPMYLQMADMLDKLVPVTGIDAALVAPVIKKVKAKASGKDVSDAADNALKAIDEKL
jgi:hypothetical protein